MNLLTLYYSGLDGKEYIPNHIIFIYGILYITYHFLDICDEKQARKLKAGSPLGYIMDHNLDSFSTVVIMISDMNILRITDIRFAVILYLMTSIPFFISTWEEYQIVIMNLPCFNGVDEGAFISSGLFIFTSIVCPKFWENTIEFLNGVQYNNALLVWVYVICIVFTFISIYHVFKHPRSNYLDFLLNLLLFTFMNNSIILVVENISETQSFIITYKPLMFYSYGALFSKLTDHLQICNLGQFKLYQIRKSILFLCIVLPVNVLLYNFRIMSLEIHNRLTILLTIKSLIFYIHFFTKTTKQLANIGIERFKLKRLNKSNYNINF